MNYSKITLSRKWKQKGKQRLLSRRFYLNEKKSNKFRIILNYLLGNWTKKKKKKVAYRLGIGFVQLNGSLNELVPRSYVNHCCAAEKSREQLIQVNLYMNRYMRREECLPFFLFCFVNNWVCGVLEKWPSQFTCSPDRRDSRGQGKRSFFKKDGNGEANI